MFRYLSLLSDPLRVPMIYRKRLGGGRAVSIIVADNGLELGNLVMRFERKIEPSDILHGKDAKRSGRLRPTAIHKIKRRGGKRLTTILLTYETAEALQKTLDIALKDARKRHARHSFVSRDMSVLLWNKPT